MSGPGSGKIARSECEFDADLRGKGYTNSGARPEEIAQSAGGKAQLVERGNRLGLRAGGIQTEGRGIGKIIDGRGQGGKIRNEVIAGIVAVEEVEEFDERQQRIAFAKCERPRHAPVHVSRALLVAAVRRILQPIESQQSRQ